MKYSEVRDLMKPGDVIAFGGNGFISNIIKLATESVVSHVGIIMRSEDSRNYIIESNGKKKGMTGVQVWLMSTRLEEYDGNVWWLPMRVEFDRELFINFLMLQEGKEYDAPQAIGSAFDGVPDCQENLDRLFCSELVTAALEYVGVISDINASEMTPADVCRFDIYEDAVQIKKIF